MFLSSGDHDLPSKETLLLLFYVFKQKNINHGWISDLSLFFLGTG